MNKRYYLILFICNLSLQYAHSQTATWEWARCPQTVTIGEGEGQTIALDSLGNCYIQGTFADTLIFGTDSIMESNGATAYIAKYNAAGVAQWARCSSGAISYGYAVATDKYGNAYLGGSFYNTIIFGNDTLTSAGDEDAFLVKYDTFGNIIWAMSAGGSGYEAVNYIASDGSGNILITGVFTSPTITFDTITINNSGGNNIFLSKFNQSGNVFWVKSGRGADASGDLLAINSHNNIYLSGTFTSANHIFGTDTLYNHGQADLYIVKYDSSGNVIWATSAGNINNEVPYGITVTHSDKILLTGYFESPFVIFGSDTLINNIGAYNIFLAEYDSAGNVLWAKGSISSGSVTASSITTDDCIHCFSGDPPCGNIYISGSVFNSSSIQFDSINLASTPSGDNSFIMAFTSLGTAIWGTSLQFGGDDWNAVAMDAFHNLYFGGDMGCTQTYYLGNDSIACPYGEAPFMAKLHVNMPCLVESLNSINEYANLIFPNPFNNEINIKLRKSEQSELILYDILSRKLMQQTFSNSTTINTEQLANGIYIYEVKNKNGTIATGKVIKQ